MPHDRYLQTERQKEQAGTIKDTSSCVRSERVSKWPKSCLARFDDDDKDMAKI
jgi:hypothetical protein